MKTQWVVKEVEYGSDNGRWSTVVGRFDTEQEMDEFIIRSCLWGKVTLEVFEETVEI